MVFLFLLCLALQFLAAAGRPNVILFVIDDLGWNDTGYQGAGYSTPNLDRLANEGVRSVSMHKSVRSTLLREIAIGLV